MSDWLIESYCYLKKQTATNRRFQQKQNYVPTPPIGSSVAELQLKQDQRRQNMLDFVVESEEKTAAKRVYRQQVLLNRELEMEQSMQRAADEKQARQEAHEQEVRLAAELERFKLDQLKDSKLRQQLRESRYRIQNQTN